MLRLELPISLLVGHRGENGAAEGDRAVGAEIGAEIVRHGAGDRVPVGAEIDREGHVDFSSRSDPPLRRPASPPGSVTSAGRRSYFLPAMSFAVRSSAFLAMVHELVDMAPWSRSAAARAAWCRGSPASSGRCGSNGRGRSVPASPIGSKVLRVFLSLTSSMAPIRPTAAHLADQRMVERAPPAAWRDRARSRRAPARPASPRAGCGCSRSPPRR